MSHDKKTLSLREGWRETVRTCMMSKMRKYKLATRRNCSRRLRGRNVIRLYLDVVTTLFCEQEEEKLLIRRY